MSKPKYHWQQEPSHEALAQVLAERIVAQIDQAIVERGRAIIAFSGGSTPKPLFEALLKYDVEWKKVVVTLVDERWVPIGHSLSNAGFLIDNLLSKLPTIPKFVPLFNISAAAMNAQMSLISVLSEYCNATNSSHSTPAAFDVVILGMGSDGHTASFFPDAHNVAELVDPAAKKFLLTTCSPASQVDRVTWSLPALLNTQFLALHFTGDGKKKVFEQALNNNDACELPVRSALFQNETSLSVYYAD